MAPKKCCKRMKDEDEDRLSQLPDSVALYILSFLSMKDAARTSSLSKYWRRRWLFADFFDFNAHMRLIEQFPQKVDEWLSYAFARRVQSVELDAIVSVASMAYCLNLRHLVVRDTSLVSLTVKLMSELVLVNNPKLVSVRAAWGDCQGCTATNILGQLSGCLSTLQILAFDTTYVDPLEAIDKVPELTLNVDPLLEDGLFC